MKKQNLRKMVKAITLSLLLGTALSAAQPAWAADEIKNWYKGDGNYSYKSEHAKEAKGICSYAIGYHTKADGDYSVALGRETYTLGKNSVALGFAAVAKGEGAIALTGYSHANGMYSIAMGNTTISNGADSTAMGRETVADGLQSLASGYSSHALGNGSFAGGGYWVSEEDSVEGGKAYGKNSFAFGENAVAGTYATKTLAEADVTGEGAYNRKYQIGDVLLLTDGTVKILQGEDIKEGADYSGNFKANDVVVVSSGSTGANAVAIGQGAHAIYDNSVAIGQYAVTKMTPVSPVSDGADGFIDTNEFAVGGGTYKDGDGKTHVVYSRITGVADGTSDHDAATYGQVKNAVTASYSEDVLTLHQLADGSATTNDIRIDLTGLGGDETMKIYRVPKPESGSYELESYGVNINYITEEDSNGVVVELNGYGLTVYEPPEPIESNGLLTITESSPKAEYKYDGVHISDEANGKYASFTLSGLDLGTVNGKDLKFTDDGVSVGGQKITNVANGSDDTDAASYGQVKNAVTASYSENVLTLHKLADGSVTTGDIKIDLGGLVTGTAGEITVTKGTGTDAGKQVVGLAEEVKDDISALQTAVGDEDSGLVKNVADLQTAVGDSSGGLVHDVADLKTTVGDSTNGLVKNVTDIQKYVKEGGLDANGKKVTNMANATVDTDAVNYGQVKDAMKDLDFDSVTNKLSYTTLGSAETKYVDLSSLAGGGSGGDTVVGKAGEISVTDGTDENAGKKVIGLADEVKETLAQVDSFGGQIDRLGTRINKVGAGAAALAAMHPVYDEDSKLTFSAGLGSYRNEQAAAVGMFFRFSPRVMMNAGATVGNDNNMYNVGLNFALDRHVRGGLPSKAVMAKQLTAQSEKIALQDARIAEQNAKIAKQGEQIAQLIAMIEELKNK